MKRFCRKLCAIFSVAIICTTAYTLYLSHSLPDNYYVVEGRSLSLNNNKAITTSSLVDTLPTEVYSIAGNSYNVTLSLNNTIPIKDVSVEVVNEDMLVVGGAPFGIKMFTDGVMVVGMSDIDMSGKMINPAKEAGIKVGDTITYINNQKISSNADIKSAIEKFDGIPLIISFKREGKNSQTQLTPIYQDGVYRCGIWVRDSTAGMGTITYYDPETEVFGGLGHAVCDVDTGEIMPISTGEAVDVRITGVNKGESGEPGELVGIFGTSVIGDLSVNDDTGVFGTLSSPPSSSLVLPKAQYHEITTGPATIYTTTSGNTPKEYSIFIEKIASEHLNPTKNMVIRVTDPKLLEQAGGIVQGMSGSPIIQNGKIIGAVTHVFVNDPTRGYGIYIDNMIDSAEYVA